jgi:hypothetical protein
MLIINSDLQIAGDEAADDDSLEKLFVGELGSISMGLSAAAA